MKNNALILSTAVLGVCIAAATSLASFTTAHAASTASHRLYHRKHVRPHHISHTKKSITISIKGNSNVGAWQTPRVTTGSGASTTSNAGGTGNPNNVSTGPFDPSTKAPSTGPINGGTSAYGSGHTSTGTSVTGR